MTLSRVRHARIANQAMWLVAATVASQAIFALVYIFAARSAPAAEFGAMAAAAGMGITTAGFLDFGANALWVREVARGRLPLEQLGRLISAKIAIALALALCWLVVALTVLDSTPLWIAGASGFAIFWSQVWQVPLRANAQIERVAIAIVMDRAIVLVTLVTIAHASHSLEIAFGAAMTVGPLFSGALCYLLASPNLRPRVSLRSPTWPWRGSVGYGVSSTAVATQSLDMTILSAVSSAGAAGAYAAVSRWVQPLSLLANAFASVSVPYVAAAETWREALHHARRAFWLLALALAGCGALALAAPWAVGLVLGAEYSESARVLQVLALGMVPAIMNQPVASFLQARGHDRSVSVVVAASVGLQLSLVAVLGARFGAIGAAIALAATQSALLSGLTGLFVRGFRRQYVSPGKLSATQ